MLLAWLHHCYASLAVCTARSKGHTGYTHNSSTGKWMALICACCSSTTAYCGMMQSFWTCGSVLSVLSCMLCQNNACYAKTMHICCHGAEWCCFLDSLAEPHSSCTTGFHQCIMEMHATRVRKVQWCSPCIGFPCVDIVVLVAKTLQVLNAQSSRQCSCSKRLLTLPMSSCVFGMFGYGWYSSSSDGFCRDRHLEMLQEIAAMLRFPK